MAHTSRCICSHAYSAHAAYPVALDSGPARLLCSRSPGVVVSANGLREAATAILALAAQTARTTLCGAVQGPGTAGPLCWDKPAWPGPLPMAYSR